MSADHRVASRHTFAMLLTRFAPQARRPGHCRCPAPADGSDKQPQARTTGAPDSSANLLRMPLLGRWPISPGGPHPGRAGRHGAEFPPGRGCAMTDPVMRALAYLSRVVEPPCPLLAALMARVGPVEAADRVKRRASDEQL